jgi:hypothetical protein
LLSASRWTTPPLVAMSAEPRSLDLSEPETPMWLPALGVLLFAAAGVWWATRPAPPPTTADTAAGAAAAPVASASVAAAPPPAPSAAPPPHLAAAGGARPLPTGRTLPPGMPEHRSARPATGPGPAPDPNHAGDVQRLINRLPKH